MKPTKNQVFCIGCKHHKMLFESEAKANNFIKFNSDEIAEQTGKAPSRSYYCSFCCGWHITSIADSKKAAVRDERDAQVWEQLKHSLSFRKSIKQKDGLLFHPKTRKFPKTEQGCKLRIIAEEIDKTIARVESALITADVPKLRQQFDKLLNLEKELHLKSSEYGIDISAVDKRYDNISKIKSLFMKVFDYFLDREKRQSYLSELSEDDLKKTENIIINNIEVRDEIKTCFEKINILKNFRKQDEITQMCNNILTNLIPKLKGGSNQIKREYKNKAEEILSGNFYSIPNIDCHYKNLILTIIEYIEDAHNFYRANDFESCELKLDLAESLLVDSSNDMEAMLYAQIKHLRNLIS